MNRPPQSLVPPDWFLSRKEAAEMLGVAVNTLAVWHSEGVKHAPPMRKHGDRAVYSYRELLEWSEQRKV